MQIKDLLNKFKLNLNIPEPILNMECEDYETYEKVDVNENGLESRYHFYKGYRGSINLYVFDPSYECGERMPVCDIIFPREEEGLPPQIDSYDKYGRETCPSIRF